DLRIRGPVTSPAGFIKTGAGWLQFENATQNISGTIEVREGRLQFNTNGALTGTAPLLVSGGDLRINGGHTQTVSALTMTKGSLSGGNDLSTLAAGNFTFNVAAGDAADVDVILADWSNGSAALVKNGAGVATLGLANSYTGGTTVNAGTLSVRKFSNGTLAVNAGAVAQVRSQTVPNDPIGASRLDNVAIAATGRLDLNNNSLIINSGSLSAITALVKSGLENGGNFDWGGPGIGSNKAAQQNAAAGSFLFGLGVIKNDLGQVGGSGPIYTDFAGFSGLVGNEVLVKFTYFGDADLSGSIDATDYSLIDNGYVNSLSGWLNGDFDYSGSIDATDYALIDNAYVNQAGPLAEALIAQHSQQFGGEYLAALRAIQSGVIPEPAAIGLLLGGVLWLKRPVRWRS
ncbi:MAG TPA: autotransporter-associated beta strand repeat-containing protein, partial [Tepidisphaeraceae bacterium]|nr:autotransporter-associated beta strand repeat-containing protein [Tepidisphaeraceae bacterium]